MNLTKEEKARFNQLYGQFNFANDESAKQVIISGLSEDDLQKFQFHLFNEAYKYSEDLKSGAYVPQGRLHITKDQLKAIAKYLVCAKVQKITESLGEHSTNQDIKDAIKAGFNIQENEVEEDKLNALADSIQKFKAVQVDLGKLMIPGSPVLQLEEPDFWEKYFLWLIHLFVEKTAREIRNENAQNSYIQLQAQHDTQVQAFNGKQNELQAKEDLVKTNSTPLQEAIEVQVLKSHLIKKDADLQAPADAAAQQNGSIHQVATVKKQKNNAEWIKKDNYQQDGWLEDPAKNYTVIEDIKAREILAAEFMRFFVPETPKYRAVEKQNQNNDSEVISKKVGLNREDSTYADEIKTFDKVDKNILHTNKELAKQYYKILIASALIGSYDCHLSNVMYSKNTNGKTTFYPIDFGASCLEMQKMFTDYSKSPDYFGQRAESTLYYLLDLQNYNPQALKEAKYEVSKIWQEKEVEIKAHLKNASKAFRVTDDEYTKLIEMIQANKTFISKQQQITHRKQEAPYAEEAPKQLPILIMSKQQIAEYERQGAAPRMGIA